jgi:hypothetical protein
LENFGKISQNDIIFLDILSGGVVMELVLSAISAGGLVGASDQFMCLLVLSVTARLGWVKLGEPMMFMCSEWFIIMVAIFWILSIAPAYASLLSPAVMNVINTITNFLSGFLVPLSSALLALASAGVIAAINPDLHQFLESMRIFTPQGSIGTTGLAISAASATIGTSMTVMKAAAKPAISTTTGTGGHLAAPVYTTVENLASVVLMLLAYWLAQVNPWLLVALAAVLFVLIAAFLGYAIYQMWRLKKGITRVLQLTQTQPRAGLAVIVECLVWGVGWFAWKVWARGTVMFLAWLVILALVVAVTPVVLSLGLLFAPIPLLVLTLTLMVYFSIGFASARALLKTLEELKIA